MKVHFSFSLLARQFLCASILLAAGLGILQAADNPKKGAAVIYATKASGGKEIIVVDLGKPFNLKTVDLQFANPGKVKVYVVKTAPNGDKTWTALVDGIPPNGVITTGANGELTTPGQGEYLVVVSESDLGSFEGLGFVGRDANGDRVSVHIAVQENGPNFTTTTTITTTTRNGNTTTTTTTITTEPFSEHQWSGGFNNNGHGPGQGGPLGETPKPPPVQNQSN